MISDEEPEEDSLGDFIVDDEAEEDEEDTGDDFVMINIIDMYETPLQIEGVEPGESSK